MGKYLVFILSCLLALLSGCTNSLSEDLSDDTPATEVNFIPLGNGISYKRTDYNTYSSMISTWYNSSKLRSSHNFDNESSVQNSEIWSEVIIDADSDLGAIIRKNADNYNDCIVYYTIKDEIVVQYYINISDINESRIVKFTDSYYGASFEINIDESGNLINQISTRGFSNWFRGTRDCIIDAYTNKGGYSILAAAATAVMSEVAAGIAIVCAAYNAFEIGVEEIDVEDTDVEMGEF